MHVAVDGCVSLPLVHKPVSDAELESEFPHLGVIRVEVLVMQHAGWNMNCVALHPVVSFAVDLGVSAILVGLEVGLGVSAAVAFVAGHIMKDRVDSDRFALM